jgi:Flp pilus assembly protein TadD
VLFKNSAVALLLASASVLASCQASDLSDMSAYGDKGRTVKDEPGVEFYRNDQLITQAKLQFQEKNYGKAYTLYKKAIYVFPQDPQAWLGFAASSDMIGRFDSSDRGYKQLAKMIGGSPVYYNNVGYSYLLRGQLPTARKYLLKAYEIDPTNPVTATNLELMKNSASFAER